ncbi:MAG: hypothetical protein ABEI97_05245 [Candidatus Nanohaloarchaea archaeon]
MWRRTVLPVALVLLFAGPAAGASFAVTTQGDWEDGTFSGTTASGGTLQVDGSGSGEYTSAVFDAGDNYTWATAEVDADVSSGSATLTVETSLDDFASVHDRDTVTISSNTSYDLSLDDGRYVRFNYTLQDPATVDSTNISLSDSSSFIIRNGTCQSDERELFSMSNRTNAHAGDPGYWSHAVCGSGFDQRHYTSTCASDETAVLSFFGSEQNTTHLATDATLFDYKLCTETLTVGVRDECPDTTKAIASIYEEDEDHIAEPGHYSTQLCGAFFDSVTAMLEFHYGPNTTVYINDTANPSQGIDRDTSGRDSWYVAAENDSMVTGIVSGQDTVTTSVGYNEDGDTTAFNLTQERGQAGYFVPFTTGEADDIGDRIPLIESGDFLDEFNPNFGFTLAEEMTVRLTLQFVDINIENGLTLDAGTHRLVIENRGDSGGIPKVSINATR